MTALDILSRADSRRNLKVASVSRQMAPCPHFGETAGAVALQAEVDSVASEGWYVPQGRVRAPPIDD